MSLLPMGGKILEKMIFDDLYQYLCANQLLTPHQSGFRPGDSTINQLLLITHKIFTAFEEVHSKEIRAIFLDLSKHMTEIGMMGYLTNLKCAEYLENFLFFCAVSCRIEASVLS